MKKSFCLILIMLLLLSSCTIQKDVNIDLFIERFCNKYPQYIVEYDKISYEKDRCILFISNDSGITFTVELTSDLQEKVKKISITCIETDKTELLRDFVKDIIFIYDYDEDADSVISNLFTDKNFSFYETDWYLYAFIKTENGIYFSVENKKYSPAKEYELTIKEKITLFK